MRASIRLRGIAAVLCVASVAAPVPTLAQAANPPAASAGAVAQARQHFTRGVKLYEEDDFRTALIEFSRAYELAPNWQVLYNIGQAHYQLRDYASALRTMEKYVAAGGANIASDRRLQVDREMDELRGRVAHVAFASNVEGADLSIDDAPLGRTPFAAPVLVGAGRHRITASKQGWIASSKTVDVAGGDALTIRFDLSEEPHEATAPVTTYEPSYAPALVVAGIGVAGVAVGTIFGIAAMGKKSTLDDECSAGKVCPHGTQSDIDAFDRNATISTMGFAAGVVGLGAGAYLFFRERARAGREVSAAPPETARAFSVTMQPWVAPGAMGVSGTF